MKLTNKQVRTALQGSIKKWERICFEGAEDKGTEDCPLCKLFYWPDCSGCPISEHTGVWSCDNTPYDTWIKVGGNRPPFKVHNDASQKAAEAMLKFLRKLDYKYFVKGVTAK